MRARAKPQRASLKSDGENFLCLQHALRFDGFTSGRRLVKNGVALINRYIFRQVFATTFAAVSIFVFVLVMGNLVKGQIADLLASGRLGVGLFVYLTAILIPGVVPYALPAGLLTGVLLVLGRLSAQNEITALKSAGISLWRICSPIFLIGLLGTLFACMIGFYYAPLADTAVKKTLAEVVRADPLRYIQPRVFIKDFPGFIIYVQERRGDELHQLHLWEINDSLQVIREVNARWGEVRYSPQSGNIEMTVYEGTAEARGSSAPENFEENRPILSFDQAQFALSLDTILGTREVHRKLSFMTLEELLGLRRETFTPAPEAVTLEGAEAIAAYNEQRFAERIRIQYTIQEKIAFSFGVLSLCCMAIPLGIKASRTETMANFALAVALFIIYYFGLTMVSWLRDYPHWRPDVLVWVPNLIFQIAGLLFLKRANQH